METELDRIKTTITLSLGTKNRLRSLKGSYGYEEFINHLLRMQPQAHEGNRIELQRFARAQAVYTVESSSVLFEYNRFTASPSFIFDIKVTKARESGKVVPLKHLVMRMGSLRLEYALYFELLQAAIRKEIEPLFRHKGRFEDHFSWQREFSMLNLQGKAFDEDVMDRLNSYKRGEHEFT